MSDHLKSPSRLSFYLDCMRSRGFTAEQVLAGTGLDLNRLQDPSRRILPAQFRRTIQNMLDLTGDPYLGIAVGRSSRSATWASWAMPPSVPPP
ncbi:protein of unknown function [Denitratisoma oestradiolicum]|uniref:HTH-type transcriptional regulator AraC-type N-terminal domain-containing protein n=1 Tax=Denitratisoma oestradiolicum TaxID=311182 RepID=A0A6S6XWK5_9PROT|nr:AraC family transcriptional regulator ligand-binding domain-containing protein [Denitratisoma oestradiolicum]CAB1369259.1 protein of unknown function [Denitratisoma oestradiolicum]